MTPLHPAALARKIFKEHSEITAIDVNGLYRVYRRAEVHSCTCCYCKSISMIFTEDTQDPNSEKDIV